MKALFFVLIFSSMASARSGSFHYNDLQNLVTSKGITTIDELMKALPARLTTDPLLVYDSHALRREMVTPATPRIVLFNEDSTLIMAITRHPGDELIKEGKDGLEVISYDSNTDRFVIRDLIFNGEKTPFADGAPEENPAVCLKCHGQNPRPIFQNYNAWPGFYGSFATEGVAVKGSKEVTWLSEFLKTKGEMPRYREIKMPALRFESGDIIYGSSVNEAGISSNLVFGQNIEFLMLQRLARRIVDRSDFATLVPVLSYLGSDFSSCGPIRERVKEAYSFLAGDSAVRTQKLLDLREKIYSQAKGDFDFKKKSFDQFNVVDEKYDERGVIDFTYDLMGPASDPFFNEDPDFFNKEMVLMEVMLKRLGYNVEDVSTFPMARNLGVFHIRIGFLYPDEQYFLGLTTAIAHRDSSLLPSTPLDCADLKAKTKKYLENLSLEGVERDGILFK